MNLLYSKVVIYGQTKVMLVCWLAMGGTKLFVININNINLVFISKMVQFAYSTTPKTRFGNLGHGIINHANATTSSTTKVSNYTLLHTNTQFS